jgi:PAS domain-containing protein
MKSRKTDVDNLRHCAEELLKNKNSKVSLQLSEKELLNLIYELEVHQVELELQNEELTQAQSEARNAAEKYIELYDFAPIGYLTLSNDGKILDINLCASQMLGKDRVHLIKSHLGFFITNETKPIFNHFLSNVFNSQIKETCEVTLLPDNKTTTIVSITGIISMHKEQCLLTLMDITLQKKAEVELEKWATIFKPKAN